MNIWDTLPVPFWNAADEGGGGDAGDAGAGEGAGEGEGAEVTDWRESLSEEDRAFVGDRDLAGLVEYAKSQRTAAGKRVEDVTKEHGLLKPPAAGEDVGEFFAAFKPQTAEEYGKPLGREGDAVSAEDKVKFEAAFAADLHPDQFRRFEEKMAELRETADKDAAEQMVGDLKSDWGADFEGNSQAVSKAVQALGLGDKFAQALSNPGLGATPEDFRAVMEGLKDIGLNMREGGGTGGEGDAGGARSAADELAALEQEIIQNGGKATPDQQRRQAELIERKIQEQAGKAA